MLAFFDRSGDDKRVIELADGRILFLPGGRAGGAFEVPDYTTAWTLEERLRQAERVGGTMVTVVFLAAGLMGDWRILAGLALPILVMFLVPRVLTRDLREATDRAARVETLREVEEQGVGRFLTVLGIGGLPLAFLWYKGLDVTSKELAEGAVVLAALLAGGVQIACARRAARERREHEAPRTPGNEPIVPR